MVQKVHSLAARVLKVAALLTLLLLIGIGTYWIYLYQQIRSTAVRDEAHPADAIIVLGAAQYNGRPSPVFKARLDHALHLRNQGYAFAIITTGSYGSDPYYSEAQVGADYLIGNGVDADEIITEQGSLTSLDSIRAASEIMRSKKWTTALVVSDGFHLYRLKTMFADEGITAYTSPAPASPIEVASSHRFWYSLREVFLCSAYKLIDL